MAELLLVLTFLVPAVFIAVVAMRVHRVAVGLRDPDRLAQRLQRHVEQALERAGLDPDNVAVEKLEDLEALPSDVSDELRKSLMRTLLGGEDATSASPSAGASGPPQIHSEAQRSAETWQRPQQDFGLPAPIDAPSRSRAPLRIAVTLILMLAGLATWLQLP